MMVQVHMIAKKIHMTMLNAIDTFLQEFVPHWLLHVESLTRFLKFCEAHDRPKVRELVLLCWGNLPPRSTPCCTSSIPKGFASVPIVNSFCSEELPRWQTHTEGLPDSKLPEACRKKRQKSRGIFFTLGQHHILELFGITGEILEQVYRKSSKRRRAEPDLSHGRPLIIKNKMLDRYVYLIFCFLHKKKM